MLSNTEISTNEPKIQPEFHGRPYKEDPFTIADGHYIGDDGFVVPNNFSEFFERFPHYIRMWVHKNAYWCPAADAGDLSQDLILHMQHLPLSSKHRLPGANHRLDGCRDVIETFDPYKQHGASERRFRNYVNLCLANKLRTMRSKTAKDALSQQGNLSFCEDSGLDDLGAVDDEYLHLNSEEYRRKTIRSEKQREDRVFAREFAEFVQREDHTALHAITAVSETTSHEDAARRLGVSEYEYFRLHERLRQLAKAFIAGAEVPCPRGRYRRRNSTSRERVM